MFVSNALQKEYVAVAEMLTPVLKNHSFVLF